MTIYNGMVFLNKDWPDFYSFENSPKFCPTGDVTWWVEAYADIKSIPDVSDPKLGLHDKYGCECGGYLRIIYSYRMQDHVGAGRKECHKAYCGNCARPMAGGAALRHAVTANAANDYVLYFGKHKGKKLIDVPKDYLEWCLDNLSDKNIVKNIETFLATRS